MNETNTWEPVGCTLGFGPASLFFPDARVSMLFSCFISFLWRRLREAYSDWASIPGYLLVMRAWLSFVFCGICHGSDDLIVDLRAKADFSAHIWPATTLDRQSSIIYTNI